jgi:hypothetical protein
MAPLANAAVAAAEPARPDPIIGTRRTSRETSRQKRFFRRFVESRSMPTGRIVGRIPLEPIKSTEVVNGKSMIVC